MSDHAQSVGVNVVSMSFVICFSVSPKIEVVCVMATIYKRLCNVSVFCVIQLSGCYVFICFKFNQA